MKIGIISDTHGIASAWEKAMEIFKEADIILHAGDVLYHPLKFGYTKEYDVPSLADMINACPIPIVIARGNCDPEVYEQHLQMPVLSPYATVEHGGLRIVVNHGHNLQEGMISVVAEKYRADVFVTGHTHMPVLERMGNTLHINPGSPSHPRFELKGVPTPTVALISDDLVEVISINTHEVVMNTHIRAQQQNI